MLKSWRRQCYGREATWINSVKSPVEHISLQISSWFGMKCQFNILSNQCMIASVFSFKFDYLSVCAYIVHNILGSARWYKITTYSLDTDLRFLLTSRCSNWTNYLDFQATSSFLHGTEVINQITECRSEEARYNVSSIGV